MEEAKKSGSSYEKTPKKIPWGRILKFVLIVGFSPVIIQGPAKCNSALQILLYLDTLHEEGSCVEASISFHDHLADVSVAEWDRLRERIAWYSDDNGDPIMASTEAQETT